MNRAQALRFAVVALIWGCTWRVIADQLRYGVPAESLVAIRFLIGAAALFAIVAARGGSLRLSREGHRFAAAVGLFQFVGNFNFVYQAERHVTSGLPAVVFALLIVPNALLARAFLGQRLPGRVLAGASLGIVGVALLFRRDLADPGSAAALGLALTVGGMLSASVSNVAQAAPIARRLPPMTMLAYAMLYGALLDAALALARHGMPAIPDDARFWAGLLYLALIASALAFALYFELIRSIGPARAAYNSLVVPFVAMTISTVTEGYRWTPEAVGGAALAFVGVVIALVPRRAVGAMPA